MICVYLVVWLNVQLDFLAGERADPVKGEHLLVLRRFLVVGWLTYLINMMYVFSLLLV